MKIALIGAGHWGQNLARTLHQLGALEAVAEEDENRRLALSEQYPSIVFHQQYAPILESRVPAVAIATPAPTHFQIAMEALDAGKDVFVEKPMTLRVSEARALVERARAMDAILMAGHLLLYQPAVQKMKEYVGSGAIGQLYSIHQERLNFGRARSVENALWSLGIHDVAVALYLAGESPVEVSMAAQACVNPGIEDDVHLHMRFPNAAQAHLHTSWLWHEKRRRTTLIGEYGMVIYDENTQTVTLHRKSISSALHHYDEGQEILFEGASEPLTLELEHFLYCVKTREKPLSDGESAIAALSVLEQVSPIEGEDT